MQQQEHTEKEPPAEPLKVFQQVETQVNLSTGKPNSAL